MGQIVIVIDGDIITAIRPVVQSDVEMCEAENVVARISPAIEMMKALLQGEQRETENVSETDTKRVAA